MNQHKLLFITITLLFISNLLNSKTYNWSDISQEQYIDNLIACQTQLQEYKWSKNIWPESNKHPKPVFSEVMEANEIRKQVIDDLYKQNILSKKFNINIDTAMLKHDIDRMVRNTKDAASLKHQFALFDNDPVTIAHCISRQYLVSKKIQNSFNWDKEIHQQVNIIAKQELQSYLSSKNTNDTTAQIKIKTFKLNSNNVKKNDPDIELSHDVIITLNSDKYQQKLKNIANASLQEYAHVFIYSEITKQSEDSFTVRSLVWPKILINDWLNYQEKEIQQLSLNVHKLNFTKTSEVNNPFNIKSEQTIADTWTLQNVPDSRSNHTAVWTGSEMIVWGGYEGDLDDEATFITGGRYDPSTDSWSATNILGAPSGRFHHSAVWTGSEMIIWGGSKNQFIQLISGGRYNPITDSWLDTSLVNAPVGRLYHSAVWTGNEMIIWGGAGASTGSRYNPNTNSWSATNIIDAPSPRIGHTAIWTGNEMIIWGGKDGNHLNTGGRYDPLLDSWSTTNVSNAPSERLGHTAIWTGSEMIIWGGIDGSYLNTGGRYNPNSDSWTITSIDNVPSRRAGHTAIWSGNEMVIWGGHEFSNMNTGGRYNPNSDSWSPTSINGLPSSRSHHTAVWDGNEMIVWGGRHFSIDLNSGGRYTPSTDNWISTNLTLAPSARDSHTAVWTGNEMIIWGGRESFTINTGGRYNPFLDIWTPTSIIDAPSSRDQHTAIWTGSEMIVWGGNEHSSGLNTGGRYDPSSDSWTITNNDNTPSPRYDHTAIWTGSEMIVWGAGTNTGGRYNPILDNWIPTTTTNAPGYRWFHTAIWTGSEMLIWGGYIRGEGDGDLYDPISDSWSSINSINEPYKIDHTAIWTGNEMIVWGGYTNQDKLNTGSRYDLDLDSWQTMNSIGAPTKRRSHTAVFTGTDMIIWGGSNDDTIWNSMGIYHVLSSFTLKGTLNNLFGGYVVIQNNVEESLVLTENGHFSFNNIPENGSYEISVLSNPTDPPQTCIVTNGKGVNITDNVTNVNVDCKLNLIYKDGFD